VAGNQGANIDYVISGLREMEDRERGREEEKKEEVKASPQRSAAASWVYSSP